MERIDIKAISGSYPFSSYVVGHKYQYSSDQEVGVGDLVRVCIGYVPANQVIEVCRDVTAEARVVAVYPGQGTPVEVCIDPARDPGSKAVVRIKPGSTVRVHRSECEVVSLRIYEPDDESVFTDVPAADAYGLTRHEAVA